MSGMERDMRIFDHGWNAFKRYKLLTDNPYAKGPRTDYRKAARAAWSMGWKAAKKAQDRGSLWGDKGDTL